MAFILATALLPAMAAAQPPTPPPASPASRPPEARRSAEGDRPARLLDDSAPRILDTSPRVIRPRWQSEGPPAAAPALAEQVVEARGRIVPVAGANWFAVRFLREANEVRAPQLLLPCQLLEEVESLAQGRVPPVLKVTGETTWYRGRAFLFLREVIVEEGPAAVPGASDAARPPEGNAPLRAGPDTRPVPDTQPVLLTELATSAPASEPNGPSSRPAPAPTTRTTAPGGTDPDEILQRLARDRPGRTVVPTAPLALTQPAAPSVAPLPPQPTTSSTRGSMIVDRVVRIYPEGKGGWWVIGFQGDNTLREPPIRLLPSPLLEEAEKDVAAAPAKIKFRVTGELTEYKGRRYLLLRKLLVEKDLGQL